MLIKFLLFSKVIAVINIRKITQNQNMKPVNLPYVPKTAR
jgi:hypothetical protein